MPDTVTLVKDATTVTLPAPGYPERPNKGLQQNITRAGGGRVMSVTRAVGTIQNPELLFELTEAEYDDLEDFVVNTIVGAQNSFTYTDEESTAHTAYYLGGIPGESDQADVWVVRLRLAYV